MQVNNVAWVECKFIDDRMDSSSYITQINMGLFDIYKKESTDFQIKTLDDICNKIIDGPFGSDILEEDYVEQGVPFIRVQNITEYGFEDSNLVFISEKANKRIIRSECRPGDLVFTKTGRLGTVCVLNNEYSNYNIRGDLAKLQLKSHIDPYYVMSYLNSNFGTKITNSYSSGSTRGRILISNIKKIFTPIPSPEIQKYIGDKVRKAEELREEAKRLKKEAEEILSEKLNVKELLLKINKYTEKHNWINDSDINDRMDALYYNPQKTIIRRFYKKYDLRKLNTLVDYKKGFAFKSEDYCHSSTNTFLLRVSDISNNEVNMDNMIKLSDKFYQEYIDFNLFNEDIVMVVTGNTTGKSVIINNSKSKLLLNQNAIRMRLKDGTNVSTYYIELILQSQYFQTLLKYSLYQSVQPFISMEFLNEVKIPII
ncbi:MAG: restriction endonuclease subunit S, partial [Clostridiaceae bacterium]|nr:restriction endonuclease subunit S [Clostridiaceae bacterium]